MLFLHIMNLTDFIDMPIYNNKNNTEIPEMFVMFSNVKNSIIRRLDRDFKDCKLARGGYWTVVKAVRYK